MSEGQISPWLPERHRVRLATLGKLAEEASELAARAARCIIHGLDMVDPDSGRTNKAELEREMADVVACIETAERSIGTRIDDRRIAAKFDGFRRWHSLIDDAPDREYLLIGGRLCWRRKDRAGGDDYTPMSEPEANAVLKVLSGSAAE